MAMHLNDPKRLVAESYDRVAERHAEWAAAVRTEERARYTSRVVNAVPAGAPVLELGCGTGGPTTQTLSRHFRLTGVDISERSIALARGNVPSAQLLSGDMTRVQFPAESFDAVVAFYSIIHVPRQEQPALFSRIFHWLRPGGLFLATLTTGGEAADFEPDWHGVPMFWSGFHPATARRQLETIGFGIHAAAIETAEEFGEAISFFWVEARRPDEERPSRGHAAV
jgi:ubiquinone/menaquinone biosynthesis C-methylase UbiE